MPWHDRALNRLEKELQAYDFLLRRRRRGGKFPLPVPGLTFSSRSLINNPWADGFQEVVPTAFG
ncbi:Hypothetical protein Minf_0477 [Methylacidiphilum infernorum V4]|uniref:Uncharacterized protein n=1 Tax=Methylacidiphilum infernorum (isolate V4) TaxID=481448 RepID=B3DZB8_METI4|nr:Hypothetical protein Minf_0477 [Methylacidiphilum infernorum V4]